MRDNYYKLFKKIDDIEKTKYFKDNKIYNIKRTKKSRNKKDNKLYRFYNKININENLDINKKINLINKYSDKLKQKLKNKIYKKITNITTDIHWKIINYLTNHYNHISIGKWSTKSIIKNDKSILNSYNKRFAQSLSFYTLLQRLEFKCRARNISLRIEDEYYTSKVCTNCSYKNDMLGGNEIFNCPSCNISIKRDYNGARNIMLKSLL
jgi:putative transposase